MATGLGIAVLMGLAAWGGASMASGGKKKASPSAPAAQPSGNLTEEETSKAINLKAMRASTFFSSPTGVLNTASRRGTRLRGQ